MIQKIKQVLNRDITKVFSFNALATFVKMLTGFISVKVVAVLIGPSGVALLGQLSNFSTIFLSFSTAGITNGVTKYIAENGGNQQKINVFLRTSLLITIVFSLICSILLVSCSGYFTKLILKDDKYQSIIIVFGFSLILYALNTLLLSVLNGYKQFKKYVRVNIIGSFVSLFFSASLAYFFGIYGALLAAITYQSVIFVITLHQSVKCEWFNRENFTGSFNKEAGRKLAHYSLMALVSAATVPVSQLIIRDYLSEHISLFHAGIWEGMNRLSGMYLMVITTSLAVYYLPRLAEISTNFEMKKEIISAYKLIIPPLLLATSCIYFGRNLIIQILYNNDFESMKDLFGFQLFGDFFKIASWLLAYQMVAKSMTKWFVTTEIVFSISLVVLTILFVNLYGKIGANLAYAINYLGYFGMMCIIFRKIIFNK